PDPLAGALARGDLAGLTLVWTAGLPGAARQRLDIRDGSAQVLSCPAAAEPCREGSPKVPLTPGQRDRLLSGLRGAGLPALRSADDATDRTLVLTLPGARPYKWQVMRNDWPAAQGGEGLALFLDELSDGLRHAAQARAPL